MIPFNGEREKTNFNYKTATVAVGVERHVHWRPEKIIHNSVNDMDTATPLTDNLITALASGDSDAIHAALYECLLFKSTYRFTPEQLDSIVPALDREYRTAYMALQVLQAADARQGVLPNDTKALARRLRQALERFRDDPGSRPLVRHALRFLASLGDRAVIDQLAFDAPRFDGIRARREDYLQPGMAGILTQYDTELSRLQASLVKKRDFLASKEIRAIREYAKDPRVLEEMVKEVQDQEVEIF